MFWERSGPSPTIFAGSLSVYKVEMSTTPGSINGKLRRSRAGLEDYIYNACKRCKEVT